MAIWCYSHSELSAAVSKKLLWSNCTRQACRPQQQIFRATNSTQRVRLLRHAVTTRYGQACKLTSSTRQVDGARCTASGHHKQHPLQILMKNTPKLIESKRGRCTVHVPKSNTANPLNPGTAADSPDSTAWYPRTMCGSSTTCSSYIKRAAV